MFMKVKEWLRCDWEYCKNNVLAVSVYIVLIIGIIMVIAYVINFFGNGISNNPSDWAFFGSYLGSITGLLAFAGVLYSINESKKQSKINEERTLFFKMIDLHQKKASSILKVKVVDVDQEVDIGSLIIEHTIIAIIYHYIAGNNINDISKDLKSREVLVNGIAETLGENSYEWSQVQLQMAIRFNITINAITIPKKISHADKDAFISHLNWAVDIISLKSDINFHSYCYNIINYTSNYLVRLYGNLFSSYINNMMVFFEFAQNSTKPKYYTQFYISQISTPELLLIFYYSLSKEGSLELINYSKETDLFKKFDIAYFVFFLARKEGITESKKIGLFIENLFKIFEQQAKYCNKI